MMDAVIKAHDGKVQMIEIVRFHQHASGVRKSGDRCVGWSRRGLTTKIHARVDARGRPVRLMITSGEAHDATCADDGLDARAVGIADKGYDADLVRAHIRDQGAIPNIPNRSNRKRKFRRKKAIYRERNHVERFFNKLK